LQELVRSAQRDLTSVANRANALSLFSENETLEDISTGDLVYLFVPYVDAELHDRTYRPDPLERLMGLRQIQVRR
jgi:immunoglobulin-binding protein 1